ncbi:YckD family protein [Bacillus sp. FJAT-45350]|uniref:YckD family protein n=1 Tax=Bacillus sp. FJAT-45350 TaxID=2011014 RepID=UPI0015C97D9E|nr:YckD family protein [Bacillus sp. FJAT-45350]
MKKFCLSFVAASVLLVGPLVGHQIHAEEAVPDQEVSEILLTKKQQQELSVLYEGILVKQKEVIGKYVEFGVFTDEKGKKIIEHFESHHSKLKENGYIPKWNKHKKGHSEEE